MAHKSRKKHIKHVKAHQADDTAKAHPPGTKATSAALGATTSHKVRLTSRAKTAAKAAVNARAGKVVERARAAKAEGTAKAKAKGGLVRRIAKAATKKIAAKPQRALSRAKARVRSLLGRDKVAA